MKRSKRWSAIVAGVIFPAVGGLGITPASGQNTSPAAVAVAEQVGGWSEAGAALRETQQGGRPTIIVATTRTDNGSKRLRAALPAYAGRYYLLAEVDAVDQVDWLRQIGITGVPAVAVYASVDGELKLMGTNSGVTDPAAVAAWIPTLWKKPATSRVDGKVAQSSYQQASPQAPSTQTPQYFQPNLAPPAASPPAMSGPTYYVTTPAPVAAAPPAPTYYVIQPETVAAAPVAAAPPNYTTPPQPPMTLSPAAAPIVVNPPRQTIVIGPTPAPNVVAAAPPAAAPPQYLLPAPVAASPPTMMPVAASPPVQTFVGASPVAASPVQLVAAAPPSISQFVASAPVAAAPPQQNVVVAVRPLSLRNRIGAGIGQILVDRNRPKFEVVQAANLAAVQGAPSFYAAQPQVSMQMTAPAPTAYCPPPQQQQQQQQQPAYSSEQLPPLPSAQSQCLGCRNGSGRHNHK